MNRILRPLFLAFSATLMMYTLLPMDGHEFSMGDTGDLLAMGGLITMAIMVIADLIPKAQTPRGVVHNPSPLVTMSTEDSTASTSRGCSDKPEQQVQITDPGDDPDVEIGQIMRMVYGGSGKICHRRRVVIRFENGSAGKFARFVRLD